MSKPHPHEKVIVAYFRGVIIQQYEPKTGEWSDWPVYDPRFHQRPPAFALDISYRIKPHSVGLTLDNCEIEALWTMLQHVGGYADSTARRYADSLLTKLNPLIPAERKYELQEWKGIEGPGVQFLQELP